MQIITFELLTRGKARADVRNMAASRYVPGATSIEIPLRDTDEVRI